MGKANAISFLFRRERERVLSKNWKLCCVALLQAIVAVAATFAIDIGVPFGLAVDSSSQPAKVSFPLANSILVLRASCIVCYENNHNQCVQSVRVSVCVCVLRSVHKSGDDAEQFFIFYSLPLSLHGSVLVLFPICFVHHYFRLCLRVW